MRRALSGNWSRGGTSSSGGERRSQSTTPSTLHAHAAGQVASRGHASSGGEAPAHNQKQQAAISDYVYMSSSLLCVLAQVLIRCTCRRQTLVKPKKIRVRV